MPTTTPTLFQFGQFQLDVDAGELRRDGRPVKLQPQPFRLLSLVVRRAGSLVTRDEIRAELWPEGTYVDFDQAVNFAVKQIRDAVGDSAERPLYLQTVPRRGYRFIAPVEQPGSREAPEVPVAASAQPGTNTVRLQKALWANIAELRMAQERQKRLTTIALLLAAGVVAAAIIGYLLRG
jgi:DNA-binding winged helix-turn-helix (wHTH) protein